MTADGAEVGSAEVTGDGAEVMADLTPDNLIRGVQICQENVADSVKTCQETITKFTKKLSNALKASADELVDAKKKGRELKKKVSELEKKVSANELDDAKKKVSELEKKVSLRDVTAEALQRENTALKRENTALKRALRVFSDGGWRLLEPTDEPAAAEVPAAEPAAAEVAAAEPAAAEVPAADVAAADVAAADVPAADVAVDDSSDMPMDDSTDDDPVNYDSPAQVEQLSVEAVARMRRSDAAEQKAKQAKRAATIDSDTVYAAKLALGDRTDKPLTRRHSDKPARVVKKQKTADRPQSDGSQSDEVLSDEEEEEGFLPLGVPGVDNSRFGSEEVTRAFYRSLRRREVARQGGFGTWPFDRDVPQYPKHGQAKSREQALHWLQGTVRSTIGETVYICYTINGKPKWFGGMIADQRNFTNRGANFIMKIKYKNGDADEFIKPISEVRFGNIRNAEQHEGYRER